MHTRESLRAQFAELGLAGRCVMVHASLRAVGKIEGAGDALIAALRDALGSEGTLLMVLDADPDEPFDALTTPVDVEDMGVLAELFRQTPGVRVNDHVAARFAAIGPATEELLFEETPLDHYFGRGSVLERFTALGGQVLRLGADVDTTTLTHHAEYLADVPDKRSVVRTLVRADVGEVRVESLDDTHGIRDWEEGDYFSHILLDFVGEGHARIGPVGDCVAELLDARTFVAFAVAWLERVFGHGD